MGLEAIGALALFVALGIAALRASGSGAQVMSGLFRPPTDLGWPTGVQEDDDLHWTWAAPGVAPHEAPPLAEAEWQEVDPSSLRVPAQPIVRRALVIGHQR